MKYTTEIIINLPREEVIRKLDNPENMKHWQRGLINYEVLTGIPGTEGAQMKLQYKFGKRDMILTERITEKKFPEKFHATYDTKGVHNIQENYFQAVDSTTTRWVSNTEFRFNSFGMKLMGWIMPGAFKKQSVKYLQDFKKFAENEVSVVDNK